MVCEMRQLDPISMLWNSYHTVFPAERKTLVQNLPEGQKLLYVIECSPDDKTTSIHRAPYDPMNVGDNNEWIGQRKDLEFVRTLNRGEEYILTVRHDGSKTGRFMKFTHK